MIAGVFLLFAPEPSSESDCIVQTLFNNLWYEQNPTIGQKLLLYLLVPLGWIYGFFAALNRRFAKAQKAPLPTISVGNLTLGGSGKTPTTMMIAELLMENGVRPCVISRGYKAKLEGQTAIVSDGKTVFLSAEVAGDEPVMMARRLLVSEIPVVIGARRIDAARLVAEKLPADLLVLDDGFQHHRLHRDLNILCVNGRLGFGNGRVVPAGPLREPISALRHADLVLVNRYDGSNRATSQLSIIAPDIPTFSVPYRIGGFVDLSCGETIPINKVANRPVIAFSSIAHPQPFFDALQAVGITVIDRAIFPDHSEYGDRELATLGNLAKGGVVEYYVTTEKDGAKLSEKTEHFRHKVIAAFLEPQPSLEVRETLLSLFKGVL